MSINFYVNGSCNPNPGMGAYGWYTSNYNRQYSLSQIKTYNFLVTISKCEAMTINSLLQYINDNPPLNTETNHINIYSDGLSVLRFLKLQSFPRYDDAKLIIEQCFRHLNEIQNNHHKLHINLKKVQSHTNIRGNNAVDELVRDKTKIIHDKISMMKHISYSASLTEIHQFSMNQWKLQCTNNLNPIKLYYRCNKGRFTNKINKLLNEGNFNKDQTAMMMILISQHIELNQYLS